jgi:trehalose 6-phosphate synthase/phosphatase
MSAEIAPELIVASNRLPVRISFDDGGLELHPTAGGLVSALGAVGGEMRWIGWPGAVVPADHQAAAREKLDRRGMSPVFLDAREEEEFYGRVCNDTLWPLFHYFGDRLRATPESWCTYVGVNKRFAETIAAQCGPSTTVWIHDFHLMLVPTMLRRLRPDLAIGFFLHIPFPSSEVYRLLPAREDVLRGLLGADYVSFHTGEYARHFRSACLRVLGLESSPDEVLVGERTVRIGVDPIGIDSAGFRDAVRDRRTASLFETLEQRYEGRNLVLGVERLDYTKGIPQKLRAFERYLERHPDEARTTTMLQVLVPSRLESPEYRAQRDEIELEIARINGRFGQPGMTPIEYLHRSITREELVALYRRADVMLVTPLRDGMNLVAHEFVLSQCEPGLPGRHRGALVLSELAGAAQVLSGALIVNPWDMEGTVERIGEALSLTPAERTQRLETMRARVEDLAADRWAALYLRRLRRAARRRAPANLASLEGRGRRRVVRRFAAAAERTLLLDYDGTLREFQPHPDLAAPTADLHDLVSRLAATPGVNVHIVSGRQAADLDAWFGALPVHLCAEHGLVAREPEGEWRSLQDVDLTWVPGVQRLLSRVARDVPGTHVERKSAGLAWHYRQAEPEYGAWRARELRVALDQHLAGAPAEVIAGSCVVEVRARGISKGGYVRRLLRDGLLDGATFVLGAGDDRTDRDLLEALPPGSVAVHVGGLASAPRTRGSCERYRLEGPAELRMLLAELLEAGGQESAAPAPRELATVLRA